MWHSLEDLCKELKRRFDLLDDSYRRDKEALFQFFLREASKFNTPSAPPQDIFPALEPVVCFGLQQKQFSEEQLQTLFSRTILAGFWEEQIADKEFTRIFRWRFDPVDTLQFKNQMKCMRSISDLVYVFYLLQKHSAIAASQQLKIILPQHFLQRNGREIPSDTIERELRRIKSGEYQSPDALRRFIVSLFEK